MRHDLMIELSECSEFHQELRSRTPRVIHGTIVLLLLLLTAAITWMALTPASLVVRGRGRVRPIGDLAETFDDSGQEVSSDIDGLVAHLPVGVGDRVQAGDPVVRLDTQRLENRLAKVQASIRSLEDQLQAVSEGQRLLRAKLDSALRKADAELAEEDEKVKLAAERREVELQMAALEVQAAAESEQRARELAARRALSQKALHEAITRSALARENQRKWEVPLDTGHLTVLRRASELVQHEHDVQSQELSIKRRALEGQLETERVELANLELDLQRSTIRADAAGVVTAIRIKMGDMIQRGKVGLSIAPATGFELVMSVDNDDVGHLRIGMPARIKLDAYDYQRHGTLSGRLQFISPDSQITASANNATAARYLLKIAIDDANVGQSSLRNRIKLGMTGQVEIVTARQRLLTLLFRKIRQSISLA